MVKSQCPDPNPHGPHKWYGPSNKPGETKQIAYACPGKKNKEKRPKK
jgi:hypothetical protein